MKLFKKGTILVFILLLVFVASMVPSQGLADNKTEVVMWHWLGQHKDCLDTMAKQFQKDHPDFILTQNIFRTVTEYLAALSAAISGGKAPDLIAAYPGSNTVNLENSGQTVNLMPYLNADPEWKKSFYPSILDAMTINNKVVGLPVATNNVQILYNKKIFAKYGLKVPTTLDELKNIVQVLKSNGVGPIGYMGGEPANANWAFYWAAGQLAGDKVVRQADLGKASWNKTPSLVESAKITQDIMKNLVMEGSAGLKEPEVLTSFVTGRVAMMMDGCWIITTLRKSQPADFDVDVFPLPSVKPGLKQNVLSQIGLAFGVNKNSKNKALAVDFLKYITSGERKLQYIKTMRLVSTGPIDQELLQKASEEVNEPLWLKYASAASIGTTRILFTPEVENGLYTALQGMLIGDITPGQVLDMTEKASEKVGKRTFKVGR